MSTSVSTGPAATEGCAQPADHQSADHQSVDHQPGERQLGDRQPAGDRPPGAGRRLAVATAAVAAGVVLAACGGSTPTSSASAAAAGSSGSGPAAPAGVFGTVAAVDAAASNMEVQSTSGQTTVTWTSTTRFSQTVDIALSSLAPGDCVVASGAPPAGTKTASSGSTGFAGTPIDSLTATTLDVSASPSSGSCTTRPGAGGSSSGSSGGTGGPGGFGSRFSRGRFAGGARFRPPGSSGSSSSAPRTIATAYGTVQSVSGSTVIITGLAVARTVDFGARPPRSSSSRRTAPAGERPAFSAGSATTVTIDTTAATTVTRTEPGSAAGLAVGQCASAIGPANQTGAVSATAIAVRPAGPGGCTGFGGGFAGPGAGAAS